MVSLDRWRARRSRREERAARGLWRSLGVAMVFVASVAGSTASAQPFVRGDVDASEALDLSDSIQILERLFLLVEPFPCDDAADVNDDGSIDITDGIAGLGFLFLGSAPPPAPFPECGEDPTADAFGCDAFPPCEEDIACLSEETLEEVLTALPELTFCLPAGLLNFDVDGFDVSVCAEDGAAPCGETEDPGCPIELESFTPFVDVAGETVGLRVEGRIEGLPIDITEGVFNTTTTCITDVEGDEPDSPFVIDVTLPLVTADAGAGVREIVGTGDPEVELAEVRIAASGGLVCAIFVQLQGEFIELLIGPLEDNLGELKSQVDEVLIGLLLCP